jgi:hypothetical protein
MGVRSDSDIPAFGWHATILKRNLREVCFEDTNSFMNTARSFFFFGFLLEGKTTGLFIGACIYKCVNVDSMCLGKNQSGSFFMKSSTKLIKNMLVPDCKMV